MVNVTTDHDITVRNEHMGVFLQCKVALGTKHRMKRVQPEQAWQSHEKALCSASIDTFI